MFPSQYQELMGCFDPSVCAEDGSTFCIVLTDGNFNFKRVYQFQFSGHFQPICILHCLLDIGCELPKPQIEVGAGMDHVRQKGIEVYTSQFNSTAGLRVNLPVYPAFLEWFNDRGKENFILQCCARHVNH